MTFLLLLPGLMQATDGFMSCTKTLPENTKGPSAVADHLNATEWPESTHTPPASIHPVTWWPQGKGLHASLTLPLQLLLFHCSLPKLPFQVCEPSLLDV